MVAIPTRAVPVWRDRAVFAAKAAALRLRRGWRERTGAQGVTRHGRGDTLAAAPVIAQAASPLWTNMRGEQARRLTAGKVQNLRVALRGLDGIEVPAGAILSFWRQVGRPSRRRGFVSGRELREGCLIPSVGGGLCQLSNALYEAALQAGFEIVERHAHTRVVPGSRARLGRDATVFWNYVDLRLRSPSAFRIEAGMRQDRLEIAFRGLAPASNAERAAPQASARTKANDCNTCGQDSCARHSPDTPSTDDWPTAWLLDAQWPEFSTLFAERAKTADALLLPTRLFGAQRYGWPKQLCGTETTADLAVLRRSLALRGKLSGGTLQARILQADASLAQAYAARLAYHRTHLVIAQTLLPHLWRLGVLQGRRFDVLMERLPMAMLQQRLDAAARRHPESPTLADFRAPAAIAAAERAALQEASRLFTPHAELATLFPDRTTRLDWAQAKPAPWQRGGRTLLFPASALGRKGAYALREAMAGLDADITLVVRGRAVETGDFWGSLPVRQLAPGETPERIAAVVLPALVEHQPRALLAALAAGIPVIATPACGIPAREGLLLVPEGDAAALRAAIAQI